MTDLPVERRNTRLPAFAARADAFARSRTGMELLTVLCLALIVLMGGVLRFRDMGWDQPAGAPAPLQMHPDERYLSIVSNALDWPSGIGEYFDTSTSPLNPYNTEEGRSYVYGTLPLFLGKATATIAGDDPAGAGNSYDSTVLWGRRTTAFVDTLTIVIVFALGATLFGRAVGLAAAGLYALAVLPTQLAHFWTVDPYFTFFAASALLACVLALQRDWWWLLPVAGLAIGLGMSSKVNAGLLVSLPILVSAVRIIARDVIPGLNLSWRGQRLAPGGNWAWDAAMVCISLLCTLFAFRIASPYAFAGTSFFDFSINQHWLDVARAELNRQNGNEDFPPFVQFAGNPPFITPWLTMVVWGMGPALGLAAWGAAVVAAVQMVRRRDLAFLLPLLLIATIFVFHGMRFVAFMRYFEPIYPALIVLAAWAMVGVVSWAGRQRGVARSIRGRRVNISPAAVRYTTLGAVAVVVGATAFWALAFQNVYSAEHPRITASRWIYDNVPQGAGITSEIWDDALPYPLPGEPTDYIRIETEPYRTDSYGKVRALVYGADGRPGLDDADYVAISSNRIRDSIPRLEREYPATIEYYDLLETGELGFERVATFRVEPSFLGISINDQGAEESFTVYDHPEVRIYRKTEAWDPAAAVALLDGAHPERATNLLPKQGRTNGLQFTPEEAAVQQSGGTWSDVFNPDGWASTAPWLWWLLWIQLAAFAVLPAVTWLFRALPDRGYGLSKLLGQVGVTLPLWLLVAWGAVDFSGTLAWACFAALIVAGAASAWFLRDSLRRDFTERWKAWAATEAVFLVAFAGFLALRAWNPDIWYHPTGGEKPMEVAYLTAVTRSTTFPPFDPWFAGGYLNYYYGGWLFMAVPIRAFQIPPEVAFNLGVPTFASLAAATAFSIAHNLVGLSQRARAALPSFPGPVPSSPANRWPAWAWAPIVAGVLGAFLLVAIGNVDALHQTIERFQAINTWSVFEGVPFFGGIVGVAGGVWEWLFGTAELPPYDWWRSSRVHIGTIDITEFPYWTFLFADLHPHLMGIPFFGMVIAIALAAIVTAQRGMALHGWVLAIAFGLALGLERMVHTWDFPTAILITLSALAVAQLVAPGGRERRLWTGLGHMAVAGAVALVVFNPYAANFETFDTGINRTVATTDLNHYLAHFGYFVIVGGAFLICRYAEVRTANRGNLLASLVDGWLPLGALAVFVGGLVAFTWPFGGTVVALSAVALVFLFNLVWIELRDPRPDVGRLVATASLILGFGIAAGVDIVKVGEDIERMNTVFKFYMQAWQLMALGSAYAIWYVAAAAWALAARVKSDERVSGRRSAAVSVALPGLYAAVVAFVLVTGSIFLWSGTRARQEARFDPTIEPTLDGLAYLDSDPVYVEDVANTNPGDDVPIHLADDLPLITWLRENVEGSPVIAEAAGPTYHWTGRISINTGLPAVIGWDWHQVQQRTAYAHLIDERRVDTTLFFRDSNVALAEEYLRKYNVSYVVVGTEEHAYGSAEGLAKLATIPALTPVFSHNQYVIYEVDQSLLAAPPATAATP